MSTVEKRIGGFRQVPTDVGDTPRSIALRELGDASRWTDLVALNGLKPPYLTDDLALAGPGVLLAGQQNIRVPAAAPPASGIADPLSVFGTDIFLPNGRIAVTPGGDMATISGVPNLDQALRNVLATHTKDLNYYPRYGCDTYRLIGQGGTATANRLAVAYVARAVRADSRISRIISATGGIVGDAILVDVVAVTVDGKRVSASIPAVALPQALNPSGGN